MRKRERDNIASKLSCVPGEKPGQPITIRPFESDEKKLGELVKETGEERSLLVRKMIRFALSDKFEHFTANPCRDRLDLLVEQSRKDDSGFQRLAEILDRLKNIEENQRIEAQNSSVFLREIYSLSGLSVLVLNIILSRLIELTSPTETTKEKAKLIADGAMQAVISQTILDLDKCCAFHGMDSGPELMDELYFATRLRGLAVSRSENNAPEITALMRVVASVQAKRGSSRGLVHYIAHSKLDADREPQSSREIFNAFADDLSVRSANNSMRVGIAKGRPSNEELHHLVLSFRDVDYRNLGSDEARRKRALKEITRVAIKRFENAVNAERLLWTAAVHRNTGNPHVHIAIQKQYLTREIERTTFTKIPREALPHYQIRLGARVLANGYLIDAAAEKMNAIIQIERTRKKAPNRFDREALSKDRSERGAVAEPANKSGVRIAEEREMLAKGIAAEYELRAIEERIESLLDRGGEMRFNVKDPITGKKKRLSLLEVQKQDVRDDTSPPTPAERQIRTILYKMLAREEAAKEQLQKDSSSAIRDARRIRSEYRKDSRRLPMPSLSKGELDRLQKRCLEDSDIRRFSYLERIRADLERSGEVESRSRGDLRSVLARKNISELRSQLSDKMHKEVSEKGYYLRVDIGGRSMSLADLDREEKDRDNSPHSFLKKVKAVASRISKNRTARVPAATNASPTDHLRDQIKKKLAEHLTGIRKDGKVEQNKAKILATILNVDAENNSVDPSYSPEQIAEIEKLSVQGMLKNEYENSWSDQRSMIESAGTDSLAFRRLAKTDPAANFAEHKNRILAGRALAREIVAKAELAHANDELRSFQDGKRFQKFTLADKQSGGSSYLSLNDVDPPRGNSLLDRAVKELFEGREHRNLRRTVSGFVEDRERRLKDDTTAAKEIMVSASRNASEFKEFSYFGLKSESVYQPIFTHPELALLERRASQSREPTEAERLRKVVESSTDRSVHSLGEMLRSFESPKHSISEVKEIDIPRHEQADLVRRPQRFVEGHSR